jgi:uncharacterized membrane protein YbaN (DUF454 family)
MSTLRPIESPHREPARNLRLVRGETNLRNVDVDVSPPKTGGRLKRGIFLVLAGVFFGVAALGAVLPGLPCTPFVLLTSYFLLRSWPRMNERFLRSRLFGPILRDWQERGGVARRIKIKSILFVAVVVGLTLYFGGLSPWLMGIVSSLSLVGVVIIARLPEPRRN